MSPAGLIIRLRFRALPDRTEVVGVSTAEASSGFKSGIRKLVRDQRASLPQQLPNELKNCGKVVRAWEFNSSTSKCRRNGQVFNVVDVALSTLPTGNYLEGTAIKH